MAANLMGMFEQMNRAILRNPLGNESGAGQQLLDMASQGVGQMGGALSSKIDPYSMMTPAAQLMQSKQDLAGLDLSKPSDMKVAAGIYNKTGQQEKALAFQTRATEQQEKEAQQLMDNKMMASLVDLASKDSDLTPDMKQRYYSAIHAGIIKDEKDYEDYKSHKSLKALEGSYTETVILSGKEFKVRYNRFNQPINVLGEGRSLGTITDLIDPQTGLERKALVNTQDPTDIKFLGGTSTPKPEYEVEYNDENDMYDIFVYPADGGPPTLYGQAPSVNEAAEVAKKAKQTMDAQNMIAVIDDAVRIVSDTSTWTGGVYGVLAYLPIGTDARKVKGLLNTIRANVGFDALNSLREAGGTLGQVSNIEIMLLTSVMATLDDMQSKEDLTDALLTIRGIQQRANIARNASPEELENLLIPIPGVDGTMDGSYAYEISPNHWAIVEPNGTITTERPDKNAIGRNPE